MPFNWTTVDIPSGSLSRNNPVVQFWAFIIYTWVIAILAVFYFFYLSRLYGILISILVNIFSWRHGRIWIQVDSITLTPLSGKILFKGVKVHTANYTLFIAQGYLSFRYWFFNVRHEGVTPLKPRPSRIKMKLDGLELFLLNYSGAYLNLENILKSFVNENVVEQDTGGKFSFSINPIDVLRSLMERIESHKHDKTTLPRDTNKDSVFRWLLPLEIVGRRAAITIGNPDLTSIATIYFRSFIGNYEVGPSRSPYDYYRTSLEFFANKPEVKLGVNVDYKDPIFSKAEHLRKINKSLLSRLKTFVYGGFIWGTEKSDDTTELPEYEWSGLSRYKNIDGNQANHTKKIKEYAKVPNILEGGTFYLKYYTDVVGPVPETTNLSKSDIDEIGNGDLPPEWGVDLTFTDTVINYGPWTDRERFQFQNIFMPSSLTEIDPTPKLKPGEPRKYTAMKILVNFEKSTTIRLPFKEISKDRTRARYPKDDMMGKHFNSLSIPYAWIDIKLEDKSNIEINLPAIILNDGYTMSTKASLNSVTINSSLNYSSLMTAKSIKLDVPIFNPVQYGIQRSTNVIANISQGRIFFLRDYVQLFNDLLNDWNTPIQPRTPANFMPTYFSIKTIFTDYSLYFCCNPKNIINTPNSFVENSYLEFSGQKLTFSMHSSYEMYQPVSTSTCFHLDGQDIRLETSFATETTIGSFISPSGSDVGLISKLFLEGTYEIPADTAKSSVVTLYVDGSDVECTLFGYLISTFMKLKENYFGDFNNFSTNEEFIKASPEIMKKYDVFAEEKIQDLDEETSLPLELHLILNIRQGSIIMPKNIFECKQALVLEFELLEMEIRNTRYFQDFQINAGPLVCGQYTPSSDTKLNFNSNRKNNSFDTDLKISDLVFQSHRLYGPAPNYRQYLVDYKLDCGALTGNITETHLNDLFSFINSLSFTLTDADNSIIIPCTTYDITVFTFKLANASVTIFQDDYIEVELPSGLKFQFDNLLRDEQRNRASTTIPIILGRIFKLNDAITLKNLNDSKNDNFNAVWTLVSEFSTGLEINNFNLVPNWKELQKLQQRFIYNQDFLFGRCQMFYSASSLEELNNSRLDINNSLVQDTVPSLESPVTFFSRDKHIWGIGGSGPPDLAPAAEPSDYKSSTNVKFKWLNDVDDTFSKQRSNINSNTYSTKLLPTFLINTKKQNKDKKTVYICSLKHNSSGVEDLTNGPKYRDFKNSYSQYQFSRQREEWFSNIDTSLASTAFQEANEYQTVCTVKTLKNIELFCSPSVIDIAISNISGKMKKVFSLSTIIDKLQMGYTRKLLKTFDMNFLTSNIFITCDKVNIHLLQDCPDFVTNRISGEKPLIGSTSFIATLDGVRFFSQKMVEKALQNFKDDYDYTNRMGVPLLKHTKQNSRFEIDSSEFHLDYIHHLGDDITDEIKQEQFTIHKDKDNYYFKEINSLFNLEKSVNENANPLKRTRVFQLSLSRTEGEISLDFFKNFIFSVVDHIHCDAVPSIIDISHFSILSWSVPFKKLTTMLNPYNLIKSLEPLKAIEYIVENSVVLGHDTAPLCLKLGSSIESIANRTHQRDEGWKFIAHIRNCLKSLSKSALFSWEKYFFESVLTSKESYSLEKVNRFTTNWSCWNIQPNSSNISHVEQLKRVIRYESLHFTIPVTQVRDSMNIRGKICCSFIKGNFITKSNNLNYIYAQDITIDSHIDISSSNIANGSSLNNLASQTNIYSTNTTSPVSPYVNRMNSRVGRMNVNISLISSISAIKVQADHLIARIAAQYIRLRRSLKMPIHSINTPISVKKYCLSLSAFTFIPEVVIKISTSALSVSLNLTGIRSVITLDPDFVKNSSSNLTANSTFDLLLFSVDDISSREMVSNICAVRVKGLKNITIVKLSSGTLNSDKTQLTSTIVRSVYFSLPQKFIQINKILLGFLNETSTEYAYVTELVKEFNEEIAHSKSIFAEKINKSIRLLSNESLMSIQQYVSTWKHKILINRVVIQLELLTTFSVVYYADNILALFNNSIPSTTESKTSWLFKVDEHELQFLANILPEDMGILFDPTMFRSIKQLPSFFAKPFTKFRIISLLKLSPPISYGKIKKSNYSVSNYRTIIELGDGKLYLVTKTIVLLTITQKVLFYYIKTLKATLAKFRVSKTVTTTSENDSIVDTKVDYRVGIFSKNVDIKLETPISIFDVSIDGYDIYLGNLQAKSGSFFARAKAQDIKLTCNQNSSNHEGHSYMDILTGISVEYLNDSFSKVLLTFVIDHLKVVFEARSRLILQATLFQLRSSLLSFRESHQDEVTSAQEYFEANITELDHKKTRNLAKLSLLSFLRKTSFDVGIKKITAALWINESRVYGRHSSMADYSTAIVFSSKYMALTSKRLSTLKGNLENISLEIEPYFDRELFLSGKKIENFSFHESKFYNRIDLVDVQLSSSLEENGLIFNGTLDAVIDGIRIELYSTIGSQIPRIITVLSYFQKQTMIFDVGESSNANEKTFEENLAQFEERARVFSHFGEIKCAIKVKNSYLKLGCIPHTQLQQTKLSRTRSILSHSSHQGSINVNYQRINFPELLFTVIGKQQIDEKGIINTNVHVDIVIDSSTNVIKPFVMEFFSSFVKESTRLINPITQQHGSFFVNQTNAPKSKLLSKISNISKSGQDLTITPNSKVWDVSLMFNMKSTKVIFSSEPIAQIDLDIDINNMKIFVDLSNKNAPLTGRLVDKLLLSSTFYLSGFSLNLKHKFSPEEFLKAEVPLFLATVAVGTPKVHSVLSFDARTTINVYLRKLYCKVNSRHLQNIYVFKDAWTELQKGGSSFAEPRSRRPSISVHINDHESRKENDHFTRLNTLSQPKKKVSYSWMRDILSKIIVATSFDLIELSVDLGQQIGKVRMILSRYTCYGQINFMQPNFTVDSKYLSMKLALARLKIDGRYTGDVKLDDFILYFKTSSKSSKEIGLNGGKLVSEMDLSMKRVVMNLHYQHDKQLILEVIPISIIMTSELIDGIEPFLFSDVDINVDGMRLVASRRTLPTLKTLVATLKAQFRERKDLMDSISPLSAGIYVDTKEASEKKHEKKKIVGKLAARVGKLLMMLSRTNFRDTEFAIVEFKEALLNYNVDSSSTSLVNEKNIISIDSFRVDKGILNAISAADEGSLPYDEWFKVLADSSTKQVVTVPKTELSMVSNSTMTRETVEYKFNTDFSSNIDLTLNFGLYKFLQDLIQTYYQAMSDNQPSSLNETRSPINGSPDGYTATITNREYNQENNIENLQRTFLPLTEVIFDPRLKVTGDAKPFEWLEGLGINKEKIPKIIYNYITLYLFNTLKSIDRKLA